MPQEFNYQSTIKNIQSKLIGQSIRDTANLDFLKSEESMREVIRSYQDRFSSTRDMLFDATRYIASSSDIIRVESFNDLFESVFIDLSALYNDLSLVDKVLKLNLGRNKRYFRVVKKRIRDLWNKLHLTRLLVYDENPSDESFYESFFTKINAKSLNNLTVDKKNGFMHLAAEFSRTHAQPSLIKTISSTTYPEANDNGGIRRTTNSLNTFEENYTNGPRDMLKNGLWKEQFFCNEIPDINVNIASETNPVYRNYKGIVSLVDIEYIYPVEINRLDFDVFGDMITSVDAVLYKETSSAEWSIVNLEKVNRSPIEDSYGESYSSAKTEGFDVMSICNISKIKAKHLRLIFNQENYIFLDSKDIKEKTVDEKIQEDLSERRYELVRFGSDIDDILSKPVNDENTSLYYRLLNIVESTVNIEEILDKIDDILDPKVDVIAYNYERTAKFELGAWSIEPKIEKYSQSIGSFESMPYKLRDNSLVSASLITAQSTPNSSTANWYIGIGGKNIPIVENDKIIRKEPLYPIDVSEYSNFSDWGGGSFFLLDCPLDSILYDYIYLSANGGEFKQISDFGKIVYLNSRLIYIDAIKDPFKSVYTIQYPTALTSSVNLYVLKSKTGVNSPKHTTLDIVSSRKEVLQAFINEEKWKYNISNEQGENPTLSNLFSVTSAIATIEEAKKWFGPSFNSCLFVGETVVSDFNIDIASSDYSSLIRGGNSKVSSSYSDVKNYLSGLESGFSDLKLISNMENAAPLSTRRVI